MHALVTIIYFDLIICVQFSVCCHWVLIQNMTVVLVVPQQGRKNSKSIVVLFHTTALLLWACPSTLIRLSLLKLICSLKLSWTLKVRLDEECINHGHLALENTSFITDICCWKVSQETSYVSSQIGLFNLLLQTSSKGDCTTCPGSLFQSFVACSVQTFGLFFYLSQITSASSPSCPVLMVECCH